MLKPVIVFAVCISSMVPASSTAGEALGVQGAQTWLGHDRSLRKLGMTVIPLEAPLAQHLGMKPETPGVQVVSIAPSGSAFHSGVQRGDVILEVDHHPVSSSSQLLKQLSKASAEHSLLLINREGWKFYVTLRP